MANQPSAEDLQRLQDMMMGTAESKVMFALDGILKRKKLREMRAAHANGSDAFVAWIEGEYRCDFRGAVLPAMMELLEKWQARPDKSLPGERAHDTYWEGAVTALLQGRTPGR